MSTGVLSWIILLFLAITWGSSYVLIKKGLIAFSPLQLACLRVSLSGLAFLPMYLIYRKQIDWRHWKALLIVGLAGTFIPAFLYAVAQSQLSSSVTGVLSALLLLLLLGSEIDIQGSLWSGLLVFIATACYGLSSNTVKAKLQKMNPLALSAAAFVMIVPAAIIMLPFIGIPEVLANHPAAWSALGYITLLSLAGTVLASILFFYLVQITNPIFASTVSYLIPMIALFWGRMDEELINLAQVGGMLIILVGVYLTRKK